MTTLRQLKEKYSGQVIPDWELEAAGLKDKPAESEAPKRRGRPPKVEDPAPEAEAE